MNQLASLHLEELEEWTLSCPRCHTPEAMVLKATGAPLGYRCLVCGYFERAFHETLGLFTA
jgi:uncharacterized Zn finger protein